jgi:hypothetical protein
MDAQNPLEELLRMVTSTGGGKRRAAGPGSAAPAAGADAEDAMQVDDDAGVSERDGGGGSATDSTPKSRRGPAPILRPIICICNDLSVALATPHGRVGAALTAGVRLGLGMRPCCGRCGGWQRWWRWGVPPCSVCWRAYGPCVRKRDCVPIPVPCWPSSRAPTATCGPASTPCRSDETHRHAHARCHLMPAARRVHSFCVGGRWS